MKKENFFLCYILVSISILFLAFKNNVSLIERVIVLGMAIFFGVALTHHFYEIKSSINRRDYREGFNYENILLIICAGLSAAITWFINHTLGYGPIVANGIVGIIVGLFSTKRAGAFYIASFIGMSSQEIVHSMTMAGIIGMFAGFLIIFTQEIYAGVGGKGGTIAAFSTMLIKLLMGLFI